MVQIPRRRFPRAATSRSRSVRVDSWLAISRFSCSRHPFLQLACTCHRCPQTIKLCGHRNEILVLRATSAVCPHVRRPHVRLRSSARCSWSVCTCPSHGRPILQVRGTVGRVWSPQISTFTCRSLKAARDPGRGVHGPNLPRSRRSSEGESVASRSQHCGTGR